MSQRSGAWKLSGAPSRIEKVLAKVHSTSPRLPETQSAENAVQHCPGVDWVGNACPNAAKAGREFCGRICAGRASAEKQLQARLRREFEEAR